MSAIEYLLTNHVAAEDVRTAAVAAGVAHEDIEELYDTNRAQGWAAEFVKVVGVGAAWITVSDRIKWGNRALFDFPLEDDMTWGLLRTALSTLVEARGDVFEDQAFRGQSSEPQVSLARQLNARLFVVVVDEVSRNFLPQVGIGMEVIEVPRWTLCVFSNRGRSWRLETLADFGQSQRVASALSQQLGLHFVIDHPHNVRLTLQQVDRLTNDLNALMRTRQVITHQELTGLRKLKGEAGSAVRDLRDAPFYRRIEEVADEADYDIVYIPWQGQEYTLYISRDGSFWFRRFTPRDLINEVLGRAEEIFGI